jgi:hypothetical protein
MTLRITSKKSDSGRFPIPLTHLSELNKKTDVTFRKKINFDLELKPAPILKTNKRTFDDDFPLSPSSDAAFENSRIAKIAFPVSPKKGNPQKNNLFTGFEETHPLFATPIHLGNLFADQDAAVSNVQSMAFPDDFSDFFSKPQTTEPKLIIPPTPVKKARINSSVIFADQNVSRVQSMAFPDDFSDFFSKPQTTGPKLIIPPTPVKKASVKRAGIGSFVISLFKKLHEALLTNTFKYKVTYLSKGSYVNVYTLDDNEEPIIPGVDNSDLVIKAFHGENSGFDEKKLRAYIHNELENYHAVKEAGLPVAEIYNADTAEQDGYIIQRKVSGKVDPLNAEQMVQVQKFFKISLKDGLVMDLLPQNFALENGQVILFDFVEDPEDGIRIFHQHAIEFWLKAYRNVCLKKDQAADFLNKLSANHYQAFVQEKLEQVYWD